MGSLVCLPAQLACCCTGAACTLCNCCPNCGNSYTTRLMYGIMLLLGAIISAVMLSPGLEDLLSKVPFCKDSSIPGTGTADDCKNLVGYLAVYRICLILTLFFILMAVIMIGVKSTKDGRAGIQNGFWGIKYLIVIGGCVGSFFIPKGSFGETWMIIGMIGGFLFILAQVYLLIDLAYAWAERWIAKYEENDSKLWFFAMLICSFGMYALAIAGIVLLYLNYTTAGGCALQKFFISINLIFCLISSIVSILPVVQERRPTSGLLQSSLVSLYVVYLTWSSVANSPDAECNSGILGIIGEGDAASINKVNAIGLVIWIIAIIYSSLRTASSGEKMISTDPEASDTNEENNDEGDGVQYHWSFFHLIFASATLYVMMTLTNWYSPNSSLATFGANSASMWVKIVSSWLCIFIYNWWNVAPILFPNREFD